MQVKITNQPLIGLLILLMTSCGPYQKALKSGPENTQTGPAIRNDQKTIEKHLGLLSDENIKKLYLNLTTSIQRNHEQ